MNLDDKIKQAFKLFTGLRSQEEDQKMLEKIQEMCFDELTKFLEENLDETDLNILLDELDKVITNDDRNKILNNYLEKIEDYRVRLDTRMETLLNNILFNSLSGLKK